MVIYRIVQSNARTSDLSGTGAFKVGGRWNNPGTYVLYCAENSSLAMLENVVHFEAANCPPNLFVMKLQVDDNAPIFTLPEADYPTDWLKPDLLKNKNIGDQIINQGIYLGFRVRSAVNPSEYNVLLNPSFPNYTQLVKVVEVTEIRTDLRLAKAK
ncbi:MAG: RES domain-containing protein [Sphingobacteriales bacterium]|nr:MAG: RES domain-containing protein [Sphingobacteriales bacterium]